MPRSRLKCLDLAEANSLHNNGLGIVSVYQTAGNYYSYFNYNQGVYDAGHAKARANAAGQSLYAPIFFAVDFDASTSELAANITQYFNGVYDEMAGVYPIGVYGSYRTVEYAWANWPAIDALWQTYAWSGGQWSYNNAVEQYLNGQSLCGVEVDLDRLWIFVEW